MNFYTVFENGNKVGWIRADNSLDARRFWAAAEGISTASVVAVGR